VLHQWTKQDVTRQSLELNAEIMRTKFEIVKTFEYYQGMGIKTNQEMLEYAIKMA
jgi:hypothetical protein